MASTDAKIEKSPGTAGLSNHSLSSKDGEKPQLMNIEDVEATTSIGRYRKNNRCVATGERHGKLGITILQRYVLLGARPLPELE